LFCGNRCSDGCRRLDRNFDPETDMVTLLFG